MRFNDYTYKDRCYYKYKKKLNCINNGIRENVVSEIKNDRNYKNLFFI